MSNCSKRKINLEFWKCEILSDILDFGILVVPESTQIVLGILRFLLRFVRMDVLHPNPGPILILSGLSGWFSARKSVTYPDCIFQTFSRIRVQLGGQLVMKSSEFCDVSFLMITFNQIRSDIRPCWVHVGDFPCTNLLHEISSHRKNFSQERLAQFSRSKWLYGRSNWFLRQSQHKVWAWEVRRRARSRMKPVWWCFEAKSAQIAPETTSGTYNAVVPSRFPAWFISPIPNHLSATQTCFWWVCSSVSPKW